MKRSSAWLLIGNLLAACGGGGESPVLLAREGSPAWLAVDGERVFWVETPFAFVQPEKGQILGFDASAGGEVDVLASDHNAFDLAADASYLYWTDLLEGESAILRVPRAGGVVETVVGRGDGPDWFAIADDSVYWLSAETSSVLRSPKVGGASEVLAVDQQAPSRIRVRGKTLVWVTAPGTIMSLPTTGGTPEALLASEDEVDVIEMDDTHIYFSGAAPTGVVLPLFRLPVLGGSAEPIFTPELVIVAIAVDERWIYVADTSGGEVPARLVAVPKSGGDPVVLARGACIWDVAVGGSSVYWSDVCEGTISRVDAPAE